MQNLTQDRVNPPCHAPPLPILPPTVLDGPQKKNPQRFCVNVSRCLFLFSCSARLCSWSLCSFMAMSAVRTSPMFGAAASPLASAGAFLPFFFSCLSRLADAEAGSRSLVSDGASSRQWGGIGLELAFISGLLRE